VVYSGVVAGFVFMNPEHWMRYIVDVLIIVVSITALSVRTRRRRDALPSS